MFERGVATRQFKHYVVDELEPEDGTKAAARVAAVHP